MVKIGKDANKETEDEIKKVTVVILERKWIEASE